jgi:hypothetical protein
MAHTMDYKNQVVESLQKALEIEGIPCYASQDCVLFNRWPTLVFHVLDVDIHLLDTNSVIVHLNMRVELNRHRPDSFIKSCCTGVGSNIEIAILDSVNFWHATDSSVVFSLLNQKPVMNAKWCPNGDPLGVAEWDCFLSPYVFRTGQPGNEDILGNFFQKHPLLEVIRDRLGNTLDKHSYFHAISIFRGVVLGKNFADCHIDGVEISVLSDLLLSSPWPTERINFGTVRQSLLLLKPEDTN